MANAANKGSGNITRQMKNTLNQKVTNVAQKSKNVAAAIK